MEIPTNIKKFIIDGSNIAFASREENKANIKNLEILLSTLREFQQIRPDLTFEIICDASLKYRISEPERYDKWINKGTVRQTPANIKADDFIVELLLEFDGEVLLISNDLMRDKPEINTLKARCQWGFIFAFEKIIFKELSFKSSFSETKGRIKEEV